MASVRAQIDFAEFDAAIEYSVDTDGRLLISPSPFDGGMAPVVNERLEDVVMNAGVLGLVSYLFAGGTDIASLADGGVFFARLGRDSDVELLHALAADDRPQATPLQRLLAVRIAQDRGFKPALGVLERMVREPTLDAHLRGAVDEAIATLRGRRSDLPAPSLPSLAVVLAAAPAAADVHLRIDEFRLPPARALLRSNVAVSLHHWRRSILSEIGWTKASAARMWTRGRMCADAAALLPYEIARRFGNARVQRVVMAVRLPRPGITALRWWAHLDGVFDVDALRAGLTAAGGEVRDADERVTCEILPGIELLAAADHLRVHTSGFTGPTAPEAAAALAGSLEQDDAPIVALLDDGAVLPDSVERFGRPRRLSVWIPRAEDGEARFHLRCSDDRLPQLIIGEVRGLQRRIAQWVDNAAARAILEVACAAVTAEGAGRACTVSVKGGFDLDAVLQAIARSSVLLR